MIARIIEFSARNRFLMFVLIVAIVAGGIWAVYNTPLDAIPDLSDVQVIFYTQWEDRSRFHSPPRGDRPPWSDGSGRARGDPVRRGRG